MISSIADIPSVVLIADLFLLASYLLQSTSKPLVNPLLSLPGDDADKLSDYIPNSNEVSRVPSRQVSVGVSDRTREEEVQEDDEEEEEEEEADEDEDEIDEVESPGGDVAMRGAGKVTAGAKKDGAVNKRKEKGTKRKEARKEREDQVSLTVLRGT